MNFTMGRIVGNLTKTTLIGASYLTQGLGQLTEKLIQDNQKKDSIHNEMSKISTQIKNSSEGLAKKVEEAVDTMIIKSGKMTGNLSKQVAIMMNASNENQKKAEQFGNIAGKVAVGGGIGLATSVAVTSALITTGGSGAAFTSTIAALGGGSIASGGAGMAGGLLATQAITSALTATSVAATINVGDKKHSEQKSKK